MNTPKLITFIMTFFVLIFIECTKPNMVPTDLRINDKVLYDQYQNFLKEIIPYSTLTWEEIELSWKTSNQNCNKNNLSAKSDYKYSIYENKNPENKIICNWNFSKELIFFQGKINDLEVKINFYEKLPSSFTQIDDQKNQLRRDWQWIAKNGKWYSTLTYLEYKNFNTNRSSQYFFNRYNGMLEKKEEFIIEKNKNLKDAWNYEYYQNGEEKCFYWNKGKLTNESSDKCQLFGNLANAKIFLKQNK